MQIVHTYVVSNQHRLITESVLVEAVSVHRKCSHW